MAELLPTFTQTLVLASHKRTSGYCRHLSHRRDARKPITSLRRTRHPHPSVKSNRQRVGHLTPVSRIEAHSHNLSTHLTLDIANELYPLASHETFTLAIARSLVPEELEAAQADGEDGDGGEGSRRVKRELWRSEDQGLAADYEYVMYGKVRLCGFTFVSNPWDGWGSFEVVEVRPMATHFEQEWCSCVGVQI